MFFASSFSFSDNVDCGDDDDDDDDGDVVVDDDVFDDDDDCGGGIVVVDILNDTLLCIVDNDNGLYTDDNSIKP